MPSKFSSYAAAASAAVDTVYGETFECRPMTAPPNERPAADAARAVMQFQAAFLSTYARAGQGPARESGVKYERDGHASGRPQISFDKSALSYELRRGDQVKRIDSGEVFQVAEVRRATMQRIAADLNLAK